MAEFLQFVAQRQPVLSVPVAFREFLDTGGTVVMVEFVPNPDRVTPLAAAGFSLIMLATTPEGDAYTFAEYSDMLARAGFNPPAMHPLPASMNVAVIAGR